MHCPTQGMWFLLTGSYSFGRWVSEADQHLQNDMWELTGSLGVSLRSGNLVFRNMDDLNFLKVVSGHCLDECTLCNKAMNKYLISCFGKRDKRNKRQ